MPKIKPTHLPRKVDDRKPDDAITPHAMSKRKQKRETHGVREGDVVFVDGRPDDIVIPVMGATGTGKSTFINTLLGEDLALVGHDFASGTSQIQHFVRDIPSGSNNLQSRRLVIVDTPGFDDIHITDAEILRRISVWLASSYTTEMKIGGVVYLEDISQSRLHSSSRRNVEVFRGLCGEKALSIVVLATTKWGDIKDEQTGATREKQLCNTLWKDLIAAKSSVLRFKKTPESAWEIINEILHNNNNIQALQIQGEVVDRRRRLPETEAGKVLRMELRQLREIQQQRANGEDWTTGDGVEPDKLKRLDDQIEDLRIGPARRIRMFFGLA